MAYSGLHQALPSTLYHRFDALPSALLRLYEALDLTYLNVVKCCVSILHEQDLSSDVEK